MARSGSCPTVHITEREPQGKLPRGVMLAPVSRIDLWRLGRVDRQAGTFLPVSEFQGLASRNVRLHDKDRYVWGMHVASGGSPWELIGLATTHRRRTAYPEVGVVIYRDEWLGRGLGRLAVMGAMDVEFQRRSVYGIYAKTLAVNERSRNMFERMGFVEIPWQLPNDKQESMPVRYGYGRSMAPFVRLMAFNPGQPAAAESPIVHNLGIEAVRNSQRMYSEALAGVDIAVSSG